MDDFYKENINTEFDESLKNLKYLPWIGKEFVNSENKENKILIVGESIYNWGKNKKQQEEVKKKIEEKDFIRKLVKYHGFFHNLSKEEKGGGKKGKLFINVEKTYYNSDKFSNEQIENFWESVAFCEFSQKTMENRTKRPSKPDYKEGANNVYHIIKTINPELIILLGTDYNKIRELQNLIKSPAFNANEKKIDGFVTKRIKFDLNGKKTIVAIGHPSGSFRNYNWRNWAEYLKSYIKK